MPQRRGGVAKRSLRQDEGAASVEFAIVAVLLFLIVFGIVEFGLWISEYEAMTSAAREGARVAAVESDANLDGSYTTGDVTYAVEQAAQPYTIAPGTPTAVIQGSAGGNCGNNIGHLVVVSWSQHFNVPNVFFLLPHTFLDNDRTITGAFRCE
jgi:Flp pilus assembly protein TadG